VQLRKIPSDHPLFDAAYPLTNGYRGYKVPPGDKYRVEYLEGVWLDQRLAVVYTRNDYGDGLEIDARAHPLMPSLSGLTAAQMQESSIRMSLNIVTYLVNAGQPLPEDVRQRLRAAAAAEKAPPRPDWAGKPATPLDWLNAPGEWAMPQGWQGDQFLTTTLTPGGRGTDSKLTLTFSTGGKPFKAWFDEAVVGRACSPPPSTRDVVLLDVTSHLPGGARVALAFGGTGPVPYLEVLPVFVRPGLNRDVAFDLRQETYKSAATNWQQRGTWPADFKVDTVYVVVYPQQGEGKVEISHFRVVRP
jgi:hypothetical protein